MPRFRVNPDQSERQRQRSRPSAKSQPPVGPVTGTCPLCKFEKRLDYHHWDYQNDVGCRLCRECHQYIHFPTNAKPSETVGNEWVAVALGQLVERYDEYHSWVSVSRIKKTFKIPHKHKPTLESYVSEVVDGETA